MVANSSSPLPMEQSAPYPQYQDAAIAEAIDFVNKVKQRFDGQPEKFMEFLDVLMGCKPKMKHLECQRSFDSAEEIDYSMVTEVYEKISSLFENNQDLLSEFLLYLPPRIKQCSSEQAENEMKSCASVTRSNSQTQTPVSHCLNYAINFVYKVKSRLQDEPEKYLQFLRIITTYQKEQASLFAKNSNDSGKNSAAATSASNSEERLRVAEIYRVVTELLENHDDLIKEFRQFIVPDDHEPESRHENIEKSCNGEGPLREVPQEEKNPKKQVEFAMVYLDQIKTRFHDQIQIYKDFLAIMKEFDSRRIGTADVISKVSKLFEGYPEFIVGFNTFLPPGYKIQIQVDEQSQDYYQVSVSTPNWTSTQKVSLTQQPQTTPTTTTTTILSHEELVETNCAVVAAAAAPTSPDQNLQMLKVEDALSYLDLVKEKCSHQPQVYSEFLKIMLEFKSKKIDTLGIITKICRLFKNQWDLVIGFRSFLPPGYQLQVQLKDPQDPEDCLDVSLILPDLTSMHVDFS